MTVYSPHIHPGPSRLRFPSRGSRQAMRFHRSQVRRFFGVAAVLVLTGLLPGHFSQRILPSPLARPTMAPAGATVSPELIFPTALYPTGFRSAGVSARDLDG